MEQEKAALEALLAVERVKVTVAERAGRERALWEERYRGELESRGELEKLLKRAKMLEAAREQTSWQERRRPVGVIMRD